LSEPILFRTMRGWRQVKRLCLLAGLSGIFPFVAVSTGQELTTRPDTGDGAGGTLRRFEAGGQATDMRLGGCFGSKGCAFPQFGLGAGVTVNINQHFAVDSVFDLLPAYDFNHNYLSNSVPEGGRASEFLTGARAEVRARRYGFFADAKPGFVSWSQIPTGYSFNSVVPIVIYSRKNYMAAEWGGGVEYSPTVRVHVRVELGDLLVRYHDAGATFCYPCAGAGWTNNLQTTTGVYFGVGNKMAWNPPKRVDDAKHTFLDKTNFSLMGVSLLGQAADAITTQRFLSHGLHEEDPLAKPFVRYGWSGQIGLAVLANGLEVAGMYGLHRMHHHRMERVAPLAVAAASGAFAYHDLQIRPNPVP